MDKNSNLNSKCRKKKRVSSTLIADAVGCTPSAVRMVQCGKNSGLSDKAQRIQVAELLLEEGMNKLLNEVKRIVKF